jgi:hypothetical protein
MNETVTCPVCEAPRCSQISLTSKSNPLPLGKGYDCQRCGSFMLPDKYGQLQELSPRQRAILCHTLRHMQRDNGPLPEVSENILPRAEDRLPSPAEQADNLVLWLGDHQPSLAYAQEISELEVSARIGSAITANGQSEELTWLLRQPQIETVVEQAAASLAGPTHLRLTIEGWQRYEALKRAEVESRKAFMAMKFGDAELARIVNDYFKPAVERAGFELSDMTEGQPAGLIDDQMRVALRTSRFVIADLTHANNGAYWEAGFAEG